MSSTHIYYAAIVALVLIIVAYFGVKRWRGHTDRFSIATPATPRVREAAGDLFAVLKNLGDLGRSFCAAAADRPEFAASRVGVTHLLAGLDVVQKQLVDSPPTYVNYLAIYRGLAGSDRELLSASDAFIKAGFDTSQAIALRNNGDYPTAGETANAGNTLSTIGKQLRVVGSATHRLGVALDVE